MKIVIMKTRKRHRRMLGILPPEARGAAERSKPTSKER